MSNKLPMNLATAYLQQHNETLDDYDGICGELATAAAAPDDHFIYVEGDIPWRYHMVLFHEGLIHDAWCEGEPLRVRDWLLKMFGSTAFVTVALDGIDFYAGTCEDFIFEPTV